MWTGLYCCFTILTRQFTVLECIGLAAIYYKVKSCCCPKKQSKPKDNTSQKHAATSKSKISVDTPSPDQQEPENKSVFKNKLPSIISTNPFKSQKPDVELSSKKNEIASSSSSFPQKSTPANNEWFKILAQYQEQPNEESIEMAGVANEYGNPFV